MLKVIVIIMATSMIVGCATTSRYDVRIDSINSGAIPGQKYFLFPGNDGVNPSELQYKEFAVYTHRALQEKGFTPAAELDDADIAVFIYYSVSSPSEHQYNYSMPVFGQTGVSSSRTYGSLYSYGKNATYSGTTTYTPTYGITGSQQFSGTIITFTRYISISALDLAVYRRTKREEQVWKTDIFSTGSSCDIRRAFPVMIAAATRYIGENTGQMINVSLNEYDKRVKAIKAQPISRRQNLTLEERRALRDAQLKSESERNENSTSKSTISPEDGPSGDMVISTMYLSAFQIEPHEMQ